MLGAREDGKKGEIGPELVGRRKRSKPPGAVEEKQRGIGENSERGLRFFTENCACLQAADIRHGTSTRGSTRCWLIRRLSRAAAQSRPCRFPCAATTVMPETPAARHGAPRHGADGATHPDCRIDMNDPDRDRQHRGRGMDNRCPALLLNGRLEAQQFLEVAKSCLPQT